MSLRSNTKIVREKIRAYIMGDVIDHAHENNEQAPENFKACAKYVIDIFRIEKIKHDKRRNLSVYDYFVEWAQGLALNGLFLYYYNVSAVELVGGWLEQTEQERAKYDERDAEKLATYLIWRELTKFYPVWEWEKIF